MKQESKKERREKRRRRVRATISGTAERPRLAFFRSNKQVYAQIIDDSAQKTLMGASSLKDRQKGALQQSHDLGGRVAKWASEHGVERVVFDRGGFPYTGSVKVFADAVRSGGVQL